MWSVIEYGLFGRAFSRFMWCWKTPANAMEAIIAIDIKKFIIIL